MTSGAGLPWPPLPAADAPTRLGLWLTILHGIGVEALAGLGLDWVGVDLQHGELDVADLPDLLRAADLTALPVLVRVPSHEPAVIARALDSGAAGVVVPLVQSATEAASLVAAVQLPPGGRRSSGLSRASLRSLYGPPEGPSYGAPRGRGDPLLLAMIESADGLSAVDEIAAVAGVDGLFVGPYDLGLSIGAATTDAETVAAVHTVAACARRHGVLAGAYAGDPVLVEAFPAMDLLAIDSDVGVLRHGAAQRLTQARRRWGATDGR